MRTGGQGFEPQLADPESAVLPIKLSPNGVGTTSLSIPHEEKKSKLEE